MSRSKLTVSQRLALGFGGVTCLGVLIAAVASYVLLDVNAKLASLAEDRMVKVQQLSQVKGNLSLIAALGRDILLSQDQAFETDARAIIAKTRARNTELLAELDKTILLPEGRKLLQEVNDNREAYNRMIDEALQADQRGEAEEAKLIMLGQAREKREAMFAAVDASIAMQQKLAEVYAQDAGKEAKAVFVAMAVLGVLMAALGTGVTWYLGRDLRRALGAEPDELAGVARQVAEGNLRPIAGGERAPAGSVLSALSDMQSHLAGIVAQVRSSSESIATGSAQIATGNADLSQRTEEQASKLQQTAASMEEISGTVRGNAETAQEARVLAGQAAGAATRGGEVMGHLVGTMKDISQASGKISEIIGVIDGIAFQTNILALNAAVEAARAGEQGRGFAVVAGEVRTLAQRSAEAAREIKSLIQASVEKVQQGEVQADEAGHSIQDIVQQVQRVNQMISEISHASEQQSTGISQVGDAITQLDQVTQQNAALVEESAAAAESLRVQADRLSEMVGVFRLA